MLFGKIRQFCRSTYCLESTILDARTGTIKRACTGCPLFGISCFDNERPTAMAPLDGRRTYVYPGIFLPNGVRMRGRLWNGAHTLSTQIGVRDVELQDLDWRITQRHDTHPSCAQNQRCSCEKPNFTSR